MRQLLLTRVAHQMVNVLPIDSGGLVSTARHGALNFDFECFDQFLCFFVHLLTANADSRA